MNEIISKMSYRIKLMFVWSFTVVVLLLYNFSNSDTWHTTPKTNINIDSHLLSIKDNIFTPDPNGAKMILIVTLHRSGSTWFGELLSKSQNSFYVYEPLHIIRYFWNETKEDLFPSYKRYVLEQLFHCDISNDFIRHRKIWKTVYKEPSCPTSGRWCQPLISQRCMNAEYRIIKTVRLPLSEVEDLFLKPTIRNLKVIYLVRDPRGTLNSLTNVEKGHIQINTEDICSRIRGDSIMYPFLKRFYPERIFFLRYEDLALFPLEKALEIWQFIHGEPMSNVPLEWYEFLMDSLQPKGNMTADVGTFNTDKKSTHDWQRWRSKISKKDFDFANFHCPEVFEVLGYTRFKSYKEAQDFSVPALAVQNCTVIPCVP